MSALAWLFGLGTLAVVFPLMFHLIRRTPQGNTPFGSLMFLRPSPPRLTRRSRLENLLLLALRMAALALIAAAFMRPFFRSQIELGLPETSGRKIAVLLDTSASMRRSDVWSQALDRVKTLSNRADPSDEIAIYTYDRKLNCHLPFGETTEGRGEAGNRLRLEEIKPGWERSDLGTALASLADELDQSSEEGSSTKLQIVVVSDMQMGSSTETLQRFVWPKKVRVAIHRVAPTHSRSNASLELLPSDSSEPETLRDLVLVRNAADSEIEEYAVAWDTPDAHPVPFYVPPGSSKILPVERHDRSLSAERLVLTGDDADFDNQFFVVPPNQQKLTVAYLGNDGDEDPDGMRYYLERCLFETPVRHVEVIPYRDGHTTASAESTSSSAATSTKEEKDHVFTYLAVTKPDLVVITRPVTAPEQEAIDEYLAADGFVWIALADTRMLATTQAWTGVAADSKLTPADASSYAMLGQIDFEHELFQPFAAPGLNDFTEIRFWRHLLPEFETKPHTIASFDDGTAAIWEIKKPSAGNGRVLVLGSGWQPMISQLALSSKFLPMVNQVLELATTAPQIDDAWIVGDPIELPDGYRDANVQCGSRSFQLDPERPSGEQFAHPGVYRLSPGDGPSQDADSAVEVYIALNVAPSESMTEVMPDEQLTALGVQLGEHVDAVSDLARQRKLRDRDLEGQQRLWKWLMVGAIGLLIAETWLAGRTDRKSQLTE